MVSLFSIKISVSLRLFLIGSPMQKILFSLPLLFLSFCIAEENGAYASVGFVYLISHAVEHNKLFCNQE